MNGHSFELVDSISGLKRLRDDWSLQGLGLRSPLASWEWHYSAAKAFHQGSRLQVVACRRSGRLVAIAPLVDYPTALGASMETAGARTLHEPCPPIYRDPSALAALAISLRSLRRPFYLQRVPLTDSEAEIVLPPLRARGIVFRKTVSPTRHVTTNRTDWEGFLAGLSSRKRYDIRRAYRRADSAGGLRCEITSPDSQSLPALLAEALTVEAKSWKGTSGGAILNQPPMGTFFRTFSALAAQRGYLRIVRFRVADQTIASMIGAEFAGRFWIFKIGYDPAWSRFSPGVLLISETLRHAFENRLESYEFLGSDERWLNLWSRPEERREHFLIAYYPFNHRGALRMAWDGAGYLRRGLDGMVKRRGGGETEKMVR